MLEKERKWNSEYKPRSPWYDFTFDNPAYPKEFIAAESPNYRLILRRQDEELSGYMMERVIS